MAGIGLLLAGLLGSLFAARRPFGFVKNLAGQEPPAGYAVRNVELASRVHAEAWPAGSSFAMGDRAGSLGFLLGARYRFLHTEGLVGDRAYFEAMKADQGARYFHAYRPDFLVADRDRFFVEGDVIGVAEPIHGMSEHVGPYLLCYPKGAILLDQSYVMRGAKRTTQRYVFDGRQEVACPSAMQNDYLRRRQEYSALLTHALPADGAVKHDLLTDLLGWIITLPPDH